MAGHAFDHLTLEERRVLDWTRRRPSSPTSRRPTASHSRSRRPTGRPPNACRGGAPRSTAGCGESVLPLSAWRGRSGRRYVVRVLPIRKIDADELCDAVVIQVCRHASGLAEIRGVSIIGTVASARALIAGLPADVTELHAHRLAESDAERAAILADLGTVAPARRR